MSAEAAWPASAARAARSPSATRLVARPEGREHAEAGAGAHRRRGRRCAGRGRAGRWRRGAGRPRRRPPPARRRARGSRAARGRRATAARGRRRRRPRGSARRRPAGRRTGRRPGRGPRRGRARRSRGAPPPRGRRRRPPRAGAPAVSSEACARSARWASKAAPATVAMRSSSAWAAEGVAGVARAAPHLDAADGARPRRAGRRRCGRRRRRGRPRRRTVRPPASDAPAAGARHGEGGVQHGGAQPLGPALAGHPGHDLGEPARADHAPPTLRPCGQPRPPAVVPRGTSDRARGNQGPCGPYRRRRSSSSRRRRLLVGRRRAGGGGVGPRAARPGPGEERDRRRARCSTTRPGTIQAIRSNPDFGGVASTPRPNSSTRPSMISCCVQPASIAVSAM